jgi:hypothetical protein
MVSSHEAYNTTLENLKKKTENFVPFTSTCFDTIVHTNWYKLYRAFFWRVCPVERQHQEHTKSPLKVIYTWTFKFSGTMPEYKIRHS